MTLRNKAYVDNDLYDHAANSNSYSFLKNNHISCVIYRNDGIRTCCKTFLKTKSIQRFKTDNMFDFCKIPKFRYFAEVQENYSIKSTKYTSFKKFIKRDFINDDYRY